MLSVIMLPLFNEYSSDSIINWLLALFLDKQAPERKAN
jgi:hypothetical protein